MRFAIETLLWLAFFLIIYIFLRMLENKLYPPVKFNKSHRHSSNKRRRRREVDVISQMDYFTNLKSNTAESVRGFNSDLDKTVKGL